MKRNTALTLLAWAVTLTVANGSNSINSILYRVARELAFEYRRPDVSLTLQAINDVETIAFWLVFAFLTAVFIFLGKVFVAIWGSKAVTS